jgi:hypothetical protein
MTDELIKRKDFTKALELAGRSRLRGYMITQTMVIQRYAASKKKWEGMRCWDVPPHFSKAAIMKWYLIAEIELIFAKRTL